MPANRSRTDRWRECLRQVFERDGAIEIAMPSAETGREGFTGGANLIWRVRIVALSETEIHVEQPSAVGHTIPLEANLDLVGGLSIGQNRWLFHTTTLGAADGGPNRGRILRLSMPTDVERCQRRSFYRTSTAELALPRVECWPLLDPASVMVAEVANRALITEMSLADITGRYMPVDEEAMVLPEVGPKFGASLLNLGGGGAGLVVDRNESNAADRSRLYWLRFNFKPYIPAPLGLTARLAHSHMDSSQNLYVGMAFDFAFNPGHKQFVVDQVTRYVNTLQHNRAMRLRDAFKKSA